ncbi:MAG: MFS transporter [Gammaproteobacteria bacterium]|nr:MFS transporter [Gammaproteobacteria bacterium]
MAARDITAALAVRDFRWLWTGSVASSFAMNMQMVARGWLIYTMTSSAMDLAWVTLSFMLPMVVFSLGGGVVADRLPKKRILIAGQLLNFAATVVMATIIFLEHVEFWDFIWFGFFNGTVLALSTPARHAFVPDLVHEHQIFTAMALNTTGMNFARILGPALAGFLIAWVAGGDTSSHYGVGIVYYMIAALYLVAAWTVSVVRNPGLPHARAAQHPLDDMVDGLKYVWANPPVFGLIMLSIVPFAFGMPLNTLLPAFNQDILHGGPDDLGVLSSAMGVGAILGSLMLAASGELRHKGAWLISTCFGWAVATSIFGLTTSLLTAAAVIAVYGWMSSWNMSLNRGLLQVQVVQHMRGRIMSIDMMTHGLMPLGVIPISIVADRYDVATALVVSGIVFMAVVTLLLIMSRSVRRVDEGLVPVRSA